MRGTEPSSKERSATDTTAKARAEVARADAAATADPERFDILAAAAATTLPRERQVEGEISKPKSGIDLRAGRTVSKVFTDREEEVFRQTMLEAVHDSSMPLRTVWDRVEVCLV